MFVIYNVVGKKKEFLRVAIESWPEWDLNPRPLNSVFRHFLRSDTVSHP